MKKRLIFCAALFLVAVADTFACTNLIVGKNASTDGSTIVSYSADSYGLFGELYHYPAATYPKGTMLKVYEWDTGKYLGEIEQARQTYNVVGNMNEYQVTIGETTFGGRPELADSTGIIDYGSLIYIGLQRSRTAREAIKVMTDLVQQYGYYSEGESFTIADPNEIWLNSTCKCNRILINNLFKFFVWREVSKSFTRSIIEFIFNPLNLFVGYFTKVLTLWDILPDKPVGVFIGTTFP